MILTKNSPFKMLKSVSLCLLVCSFIAPSAFANRSKTKPANEINAAEDIDSLGGNRELLEMAGKIKSTSRSRIVQDRIVDRRNTLEFGLSYGSVFGGDAYLKTQSLGAAVDYHITPRWSLGVRYQDFTSSLTPEGTRVFTAARAAAQAQAPGQAVDIDTPQNAVMALVNWYPIYGKTSFLDLGVTQFDIYLLAGGGTMTLASGSTSLATGGLGVGAWVSKHVSLRAEVRYQKYEDKIVSGPRSLDTVVGSLGLGWIL